MSQVKLIKAAAKSTPHIAILSASLLWTYLTLNWRVQRARGAFEKQMIAQGMSKRRAQQLSVFYVDLKDDITSAVKQSIAVSAFR